MQVSDLPAAPLHCSQECQGTMLAEQHLKGLLQEVGAVDVSRHTRGPVRGRQVAHVFGALAQAGEAHPKYPDQGLQGSQLGLNSEASLQDQCRLANRHLLTLGVHQHGPV